jgi:predicted CXXCH cytochrome family protein
VVGRSKHRLEWLFACALALSAALGFYDWVCGTQRELAHARSLESTAYVGSAQCKHCHPSHYESFARTYHSRMTREASADTVLGVFDGRSVEYLGTTASMERVSSADAYWMSFRRAGDREATRVRVERSVGSHRYQQYLARDGDIYFRLPIAWDVARREFFHMNGAFLTADPQLPSNGIASSIDYNRHVTRWNDNCIFCHNVHPNPGLDAATGQFDTHVAELGVACEACHGPGAEHSARNGDPVRRYSLHSAGAADPSIRNPRRMPAARSAEVCGRCHGQRMTPDIERFHREGDPFVPGEDLAAYSTPLARDTRQNGQPGLFQARFWPDGSARLTAYEYQGYLQSACRASDKFSCESCHAMHNGDPAGQLRPDRQGDAACTSCHDALRSEAAAAAHAKHRQGSFGTSCRSCHMPDIVYGLVSIHLSHRIESPDPQLQAATARPDACTLCHIDRSRSWASYARDQQVAFDDAAARVGLSEVAYRLLAGDPIERAVAAHALGKREASAAASFRAQQLGLLLDAAAHDNYPAVRSIARASLEQLLAANEPALRALASFVPSARYVDRERVLLAIRAAVDPEEISDPSAALASELRARAAGAAIEIGE